MTLTVEDSAGDPIPGLGAITRIEYDGTYYSLADLEALDFWDEVELVNDYEIRFDRNPAHTDWSNSLAWTISVNAVDIWVFDTGDLEITE